jgi:hypothetical protein
MAVEINKRFDLEHTAPMRVCLFILDQQTHVLLITLHHIAADGWSVGIFIREMQEFYLAFAKGKEPSLAPLPIQYADFAAWQRAAFASEPVQAQLKHWIEVLQEAPSSIDLPTDRVRPPRMTFTGASHAVLLPTEIVDKLAGLARSRRTTLFMTLIAALKLVLFRWTGQNDLVLGTVVGNRYQVATEGLIGCFMNFLPLRSVLAQDDTFDALLHRVRSVVLDAYANQDCPFEKIIEAIKPPRRLNQTPIYNVGLLLQNFPERRSSGTTRLAPMFLPTKTAQLDLRFVATESKNGLRIECEYATELFEQDTIELLLGFYADVLRAACTSPEIRAADIELPAKLASQVAMSRDPAGFEAGRAPDLLSELLADVESLSESEARSIGIRQKVVHDETG